MHTTKRALFLAGGWDGHKPAETARLFSEALVATERFACRTETSLDILADPGALRGFDLIFPCWTMGSLSREQTEGLVSAVRAGAGLAGIHGGMGDAFRGNLDYEWMTGGHFVGHPHTGEYTVRVRDFASPVMAGLPGVFPYRSEQYYMLVDPGVHVLADTEYLFEGRAAAMPVVWIKRWGAGRVFYSSLGHDPAEFTAFPHVKEMTLRGLLWAAGLL